MNLLSSWGFCDENFGACQVPSVIIAFFNGTILLVCEPVDRTENWIPMDYSFLFNIILKLNQYD